MILTIMLLSSLLVLVFMYLVIKSFGNSHKHTWNKWEDDLLQIVSPSGTKLYKRAVQNRVCDECGQKEQRYI